MASSSVHNSPALSRQAAETLIAERMGPERVPKKFKVITDTSDFFRVDYNDVVILGDTPYWVKRYEKEGRFGLDDEPKYWVRRAIDLTDGSTKILKLVFHEEFDIKIGEIKVKCFRSPPPIIKKARSLMGVLSLFDITYVVISLLSTDPFKGHFSLPGGAVTKLDQCHIFKFRINMSF